MVLVNRYSYNLKKHQAPIYTIEPYVLTGYRSQGSYRFCLESMFRLHNQTVNIWSSLFLMVYNIWLVWYFTRQSNILGWALFFFWVHGIGRSYCWLNSWGYHTFSCHSEKTAKHLCTIDYLGCYLTPITMGLNFMFVEFYGMPIYQIGFSMTGCVLGMLAILFSFFPEYQTEKYRWIRWSGSVATAVPWLIGLLTSIYVVHDNMIPTYYSYLAYAGIVECIAGFFYVTMWPERHHPVYFDILPSHSIWHLVNIGFDTLMFLAAYNAHLGLLDRLSIQ